jgi:hypothetical protein
MTMRARANMKIEIGESLIFSWLRHVQGCPIAQTRWKPSSTWAIRNEPALARDFEAMRDIAGQRLGFGVFKKSSFQQFIRQAEIDVLGLRFSDDGTAAIAVDSAFHENGVQYGDLKETVGRILKKMIRAAFALEAYFGLHQADIIFARPKMHHAVGDALQGCWPDLEAILADCRGLSAERLRLRIVTNGDFVEQIIQPVLDRMGEVADTSELFQRAQQLVRFCEVTPRRTKTHRNPAPSSRESDSEPKIGEHVRQTIVRLARTDKLTPKVVADLGDRSQCKASFGLNHAFLQKVMPDAPLHTQGIDENGYSRYWRDPLDIDGARFLVCSQWFCLAAAGVRPLGPGPRSFGTGGLRAARRRFRQQSCRIAKPVPPQTLK